LGRETESIAKSKGDFGSGQIQRRVSLTQKQSAPRWFRTDSKSACGVRQWVEKLMVTEVTHVLQPGALHYMSNGVSALSH
jgi:hypothetical protein